VNDAEHITELIDASSLGSSDARRLRARTTATQRGRVIAHIHQHEKKGGTMTKPNNRHVVPNSDRGGWDVKAPGADRSSKHHDTQADAIDTARRIVHNHGGGEVVIHRQNGQIRDSDTVAPGNDPFPPADKK
jgi:Uncharacterized protein conserved in bacteria (DUF2188)